MTTKKSMLTGLIQIIHGLLFNGPQINAGLTLQPVAIKKGFLDSKEAGNCFIAR